MNLESSATTTKSEMQNSIPRCIIASTSAVKIFRIPDNRLNKRPTFLCDVVVVVVAVAAYAYRGKIFSGKHNFQSAYDNVKNLNSFRPTWNSRKFTLILSHDVPLSLVTPLTAVSVLHRPGILSMTMNFASGT